MEFNASTVSLNAPNGALHITANSRLSQFLKNQWLVHSQETVRVTPRVMTWEQWWEDWQQKQLLNARLPLEQLPQRVLNDFEARLWWEQLIDEEEQGVFLNAAQTANQMYQAWAYFDEYLDEASMSSVFHTEEVQLFLKLKNRYLEKLAEQKLWDKALLMRHRLQWFVDTQDFPKLIMLHGFDEFSPYLRQWLAQLEAKGAKIELMSATNQAPDCQQLYRAPNPRVEAQQAALWAYRQVQQLRIAGNETPRVAIVAPNVADIERDLVWALDEILLKEEKQPFGFLSKSAGPSPFYNLSLGQALSTTPIVNNALLTLKLLLSGQAIAYEDFSQWLISPYTTGSRIERQQLDMQLRRWQWAKLTLVDLVSALQEADCRLDLPKDLYYALKPLLASRLDNSRSCSLEAFYCRVVEVLEQSRWAESSGDSSLSSIEFQQKQAFLGALFSFSRLQITPTTQSFSSWLTLLQRYLLEQIHQPQSDAAAPIQIMGMLEAGGQTFDALWVMGLTAQAWPREARPNPFLPMALQRAHQVPRSDALRELQYAQALTKRLQGSATEIVWSSAMQVDGQPLLLSPIIDAFRSDLAEYVPQPYLTLAQQHHQSRQPLLWVEDAEGPEIPIGEKAPGGSGILTAQNTCPLMAYFDYRLGARQGLEAVEEGLQKNYLGTLVHWVLERFWQQVETQSKLFTMSDQEVDGLLESLLEEGMAPFKEHYHAHYLALEKQRIQALLNDWLALEKKRPSFRVIQFEQEYLLEIAGILFNIKIDRVDEVLGDEQPETTGQIILDYKTGQARAGDLLKTPIKAPQLAMYLHALPEKVVGLGYGLLHSDDGVKFSTLVEDEGVMVKDRSQIRFSGLAAKEGGEFEGLDWEVFLAQLRQEVTQLAQSLQQGKAAAVYESEEDLRFAGSLSALRLPEVKRQSQLAVSD